MKRIIGIFFCVVILSLLIAGCSNDDGSDPAGDVEMGDLVVPEGFAFETTKLINIMADGPVTRTLTIKDESENIIFKGLLEADSGETYDFEHEILVPTSVEKLVFEYNGMVQTKNFNPGCEGFYLCFEGGSRDDPVDTDGDGVPDDEDDWPNDPELAFRIIFPPQPADTTRCCRPNWSTLAFEDLWPAEGDYDFNDVIINYQISEWLNYCNDIRHIWFDLYYSVDGAGFNDGFYIKVPFDETGVAEVTFPDSVPSREEFAYFWDTENEGDGNLVLRFFEEGHSFMPDDPEVFHNTEAESEFTEPFHFVLHLELEDSQPYDERPIQDYPPYNPFLVINQDITREVHFANYPPTGRVNTNLFMTGDDTSDPEDERYYVTAGDLPWGMHISALFDHPLEKVSIIEAYPQFADWVTSGGSSSADWFDYPTEGTIFDFVDPFNDFTGW